MFDCAMGKGSSLRHCGSDMIGPHLQRSFRSHGSCAEATSPDDYQHALDANPNALLLVDAEARVHYANQAARDLLRHGPPCRKAPTAD